jgi:hypothetical protein
VESFRLSVHAGSASAALFAVSALSGSAYGAPHTDEMRTVERIRRISPMELEDVITTHDRKYYSRDWQAHFVYTLRNDVWLEDYACGEPHRDLSSVAGVRRP